MSAIEQLTADEQADIKKMSSERIRMILSRAGGDIDTLSQAGRPELLEQMAEYMLQRQQGAASADEDADKLNLSERHLQLLERQFQMQEEHVARQIQMQEEQAQRQLKLQEQQLELDRQKFAFEREKQGSLAARVKYYGDALKFSTVRMTDEPGDLPHFFTSLENVFDMYEVPSDLRAKLTIPLLTSKAKTLLSRLPVAKLARYTDLRDFLLSEFHLTSEQYRDRFITTKRKADETFTLFCSRLRSLFRYYLDSRKVGDDFDRLVSLLIADRLKTEMPSSCLKHILSIETKGEWMLCDDLANAADSFMHSHFDDGRPRMVTDRSNDRPLTTLRPWRTNTADDSRFNNTARSTETRSDDRRDRRGFTGSGVRARTCYQCGSPDHLASFHRNLTPAIRGAGRGEVQPAVRPATNARVNRCAVTRDDVRQVEFVTAAQVSPCMVTHDDSCGPGYRVVHDDETLALMQELAQYSEECEPNENAKMTDTDINSTFAVNNHTVNHTDLSSCDIPIGLSKMRYRDVLVQEVGCNLVALEDSGAEISIAPADLLRDLNLTYLGKINLSGIVGDPVQADLVQLHIKPAAIFITVDEHDGCSERTENIAPFVSVIFAVCDKMSGNYDLIITADVVEQLKQLNNYTVNTIIASDNKQAQSMATTSDTDVLNQTDLASKADADDFNNRCADTEALCTEQREDPSLQHWLNLAAEKKGNFFFKNSLLFHREKVLGHNVEQLVLPTCRIPSVLQLAHDAMFAGHYAYKNTLRRVRLNFCFPQMNKKVKEYCDTCHDCQVRARELVKDRTPISAIPRNEVPFSHLWWDCIGPLFDQSVSRGQPNYCLVICDQATKYPFAFPLRRITSQAVCDCLIQVFMLVGVASFVSSDCGSNFRSELTRECVKRLGCSPRFNTPFHSSASGQIERTNQTLKRCLHHVIRQYPKQWPKLMPYVLWAMRETTNATTGLSPYHLAFGRPARGPLSILKENWSGEEDLPLNLGKPTTEFLEELKENLRVANEFAREHCDKAQKRYVHNYNLRSTDRQFTVGQQVIVFMNDNKGPSILSRWLGPGTIVERKSPHSYIVELDGQRRHLHADRLRAYNTRVRSIQVQHCSIIYDNDTDFGDVGGLPVATRSELPPPSKRIDSSALSHLSDSLHSVSSYLSC